MHKFVIRGTRGSAPACGRNFLKHGGSTTCFSLETEHGIVVFDAGTGILALGKELSHRVEIPPIAVMFTHFHLDHIIGLPGFSPLYDERPKLTFMADPNRADNWRSTVNTLVSAPYWPTSLSESRATIRFDDLPTRPRPIEIFGTSISWCPVAHPQGCVAYKIEGPRSVIVIATDHEHAESDVCTGFLDFCRNADFLIYDAMYTPEEYASRVGWGHGNWQQGVQLAMETNVGELILTHHDVSRTDSQIDEMVRKAREFFPRTRASFESMVLPS